MYANTRADDLVIRCIRELLRRNPQLPPERVEEVAIAATTQIGDQGLTIGRTAALLAGLPKTVPGFAIDRMCAGAMTAVTTVASGIAMGAYDIAIAGGVEHMGRHPMGEGVDPNPRIIAEKLVDPSALVMGATAENLHDLVPHITKERTDAFALASQQKTAKAYANGKLQDDLVPVADPRRGGRLGPGHRGRGPPGHLAGEARHPEDPVPPARQGHRGQRGRPERRRHREPARRRGHRPRAGPAGRHAAGVVRLRRRRAGGDGRRPDPVDGEGAAPRRAHHRRHRPVRAERGVRRAGARLPRPLRHRRRRPAGQPVGRRDRHRSPAGLLRRTADDAAGPPVRRAPRGPLRPHRDVHRHRHGRHGHLGEPALDGGQRSERAQPQPERGRHPGAAAPGERAGAGPARPP